MNECLSCCLVGEKPRYYAPIERFPMRFSTFPCTEPPSRKSILSPTPPSSACARSDGLVS